MKNIFCWKNKLRLVIATSLFIVTTSVFGANISEVACNSNYSNGCTQCFVNQDNIYYGYGVANLSDTFTNDKSTRVTIRQQDNANVFVVTPLYAGVVGISSGPLVRFPFNSGENLNDGSYTNGEAGNNGGNWVIAFDANTSGLILGPVSGAFIKFQNLTSEVRASGRSRPIFEYSYTFNYNVLNSTNNGYLSQNNIVKECILNYPAFCGDGILDVEKEQCDPNDSNHVGWGITGCSATCTPTTGSCENGGVTGQQSNPITINTPGLCQAGYTPQNLVDTVNGTRHNYTWECRSPAGDVYIGGTCNAWYDSVPQNSCNDANGDGNADSCQANGNMNVSCDPATFSVTNRNPPACFVAPPQNSCNDANGDGNADSCQANGNMNVSCDPATFSVTNRNPPVCFVAPPQNSCNDANGDGNADSCQANGNMNVSCDPATFSVTNRNPPACFGITPPNPMCNSLNWVPNPGAPNVGSFTCFGSDLSSPATFSLRITPPGGVPTIMPITTAPPAFPLFGPGIAMFSPYTFTQVGTYAAECIITTTNATGVVTLPVGTCTQQITINSLQPTCQSLSVIDVATGAPPTPTNPLPFQARCTCTASPEFAAPGFGVDRFDFNMTGANTGNFTVNTGSLIAVWNHQVSFSGNTNVSCNIIGHDASGSGITTAGLPACTTGFNIGSSCQRGNMVTPLTSTITAAYPGLCLSGQTVGAFTGVVSGTTTNYTWSCNGLTGGNCSESYNSAQQCIAGTVTGSQASPITAATPGLCPSGQTVGNFLDTSNGSVHNYTWTCDGLSGGNCSASLGGGPASPRCDTLSYSNGVYTCLGDLNSVGENGTCELRSLRENGQLYASAPMTNGRCTIPYTGGVSNPVWCIMTGSGRTFNNNNNTCTYGGSGPCCTPPPPPPGSRGYCGDGIVQMPNSDGDHEECDPSNIKTEWATKYKWCNIDCTLNLTITTPGGKVFDFILPNRRIIGDNIPAFQAGDKIDAYITANPGTDGYIKGIVKNRSSIYIVNNSPVIVPKKAVGTATAFIGCDLTSTSTPLPFIRNVCTGYDAVHGVCTNCEDREVLPPEEDISTTSQAGCSLSDAIYGYAYGMTKKRYDAGGQSKYNIVYNHGCPREYKLKNLSDPFFYEWKLLGEAPIQKTIFSSTQLLNYNFKGTTSLIPDNKDYQDTIWDRYPINEGGLPKSSDPRNINQSFHVQYGDAWGYANRSYFDIRVSRPIISNTSGGNAQKPSGANVSTVVNNFIPNLEGDKNFTTATTGKSGDWSLTKTSTESVNTKTVDTVKNTTKSTVAAKNIRIDTNASQFNHLNFGKLGDQKEVYVVNGNLTIDAEITLSGVKTIIVETGNLVINKNITYGTNKDASWAFIVKSGNIYIDKNVTQLAGVFMTLGNSTTGIKARSAQDSPKQLRIDGSLYGDPGDLVEHRTYVFGTETDTALATGVVINYSNRALKFPPPMLTNFIETYKLKKIAK